MKSVLLTEQFAELDAHFAEAERTNIFKLVAPRGVDPRQWRALRSRPISETYVRRLWRDRCKAFGVPFIFYYEGPVWAGDEVERELRVNAMGRKRKQFIAATLFQFAGSEAKAHGSYNRYGHGVSGLWSSGWIRISTYRSTANARTITNLMELLESPQMQQFYVPTRKLKNENGA